MATFTWLGGSGTFSSDNWAPSGAAAGASPGTADIALFGGTGTYTVSNPGSVELETATPVNVHGLTITDPNATLLLSGQISVTNTLLVAAGTFSIANTGVNVFGTEFLNDGTVISANLGGSSSDIASNKFINNSLIDINGDTIDADSGLNPEQNTGTIVVGNNGLFDAQDDLSGAGTVDLMSGGTFENFYVGGLSPGMQAGTVDFLDGQGDVYTDWVDTFLSGPAHTLSPAMVDFQPGDTIDFPNMLVSTYTSLTAAVNNGSIDIDDSGTLVASMPEVGLANSTPLVIGPDSGEGAQITVCYAGGTKILTDRGEREVQSLLATDRIAVADGYFRQLHWIGMRHIAQPGTGLDYDPRPIRILAHAFGKGAPLRDLRLSPDHAVFVDGALVPIRYLLNGTTIAREAVAEVTYYHIQLEDSAGAPSHEIVYAEGLPVESYLNTGNRSALDDAGIVEQGVASGMSKGRTRVS